jgi:hypothetical protein
MTRKSREFGIHEAIGEQAVRGQTNERGGGIRPAGVHWDAERATITCVHSPFDQPPQGIIHDSIVHIAVFESGVESGIMIARKPNKTA